MATVPGFTTNLALSSTPEFPSDKYPEIYVDNLRLRNALRILQGALDTYTGKVGEDPLYWNVATPSGSVLVGGLTRVYAKASVTIEAGAVVTFTDVAGILGAESANASVVGKPARAFTLQRVAMGEYGEFFLQGIIPFASPILTPGTTYFLSNTDGLVANAAGSIAQRVGFALSSTELLFNPTLV